MKCAGTDEMRGVFKLGTSRHLVLSARLTETGPKGSVNVCIHVERSKHITWTAGQKVLTRTVTLGSFRSCREPTGVR